MKDRIWPFVVGNNLFPIALCVLLFIAYLKYAHGPEQSPAKASVSTPAKVPKYVEKIIEKHHYIPGPGNNGYRIEFLPKKELESKAPGSVAPDVLSNDNAEVVARTEIEPSKYRTQVDAIRHVDPDRKVIDFRLDTRKLPRKFFDLKREWHGGIYYGILGRDILEAELALHPLRIGPVETVVRTTIGVDRDGSDLNGTLQVGIGF